MSKDCSLLSNKEAGDIDTREILLNLFISIFEWFYMGVFFQSLCYEKFEELFTIPIRNIDYVSFYIGIINESYMQFVEEKSKLWRLPCFWHN